MTSRTALVTGAGSGIGRAVAVALAVRGYRVALVGRREQALEETRALMPDPQSALCIAADVTDAERVAQVFDQVIEAFGHLDLLFNNAGTSAPESAVGDVPVDTWRAVIDVNLTGAFLCLREAFRVMRVQDPMGGRIINNGSLAATVPRPLSAPYTASKHAITGLTKQTSLDGRAFNIACGQIDIGNAATDMASRQARGVTQANGTKAAEPLIALDHVAEAVCFMASLPLDANVQSMTIMATAMPFIGRG